MTKTELAERLAKKAGISTAEASAAVNAIFDAEYGVIADAIYSGDKVTIQGFGTFKTRVRAAREARNPATGEKIQVPRKLTVKFTPGKTLKERVA